jgi:D-3-phosphoglycerate dehydrogenase / 2-oxoglutarate reductase
MSGATDGPIRALVTDWEYEDLEIERSGLEAGGLELADAQARTPQEVVDAARESGARALLVQYAPITAEVLHGIPDLGLVARYGVGVDNVDLEAAREAGVWICNVTGYGDEEVATHASSLALAAVRGLAFHDRNVRRGVWDYKRARPTRRTSEQTLGILGLGRIGRKAASLLGPFFGRLLGADPYLPDEHWPEGVDRVEVDELFERADVISLHLPLTEETRHLVDATSLGRMRDGAILVNTSRGGLVDEAALVRALDEGPLAAAALDVMETEPAPDDHPLRSHPRALVTPHAAWYSAESEVILRRGAVANVVAWANGEVPTHVVVDPR